MANTAQQFDQVTAKCREIFVNKMQDYGASWRIFRLHGITDQLYIKVCNIRQRQETGVSLVGDDIEGNLRAIINYGITAIIQARRGYSDAIDMSNDEAMQAYDAVLAETKELMLRKNHDYGEAWRQMRVSSMVDLILMKLRQHLIDRIAFSGPGRSGNERMHVQAFIVEFYNLISYLSKIEYAAQCDSIFRVYDIVF